MHISIIGQATTPFGELWDKDISTLMSDVVHASLVSSGVDPTDIEAVFVANMAGGEFSHQSHLSAIAAGLFPHFPPAMRIEGACASGGLATLAATQALLSGQYATVMVIGVEKMTDTSADVATHILAGAADTTLESGSTFPGLYALLAQAHMREYGTTREHLSAVAVKNHNHALTNPHAQFHKELTIDQVSLSQPVADPLRLLDCSPISDGAAAVILTSKTVAGAPKIFGAGHAQDSITLAGRTSLTSLDATRRAAQLAYHQATLGPESIQAAEVHDCFTIAEILAIEDLGFVEKGDGGPNTLSGQTTHGGKLVINPSGGLKGCGHPVGATGVKQLAYLAHAIKEDQYKIALAHNVGGSGATAIVHILGR